MKKIILFTAFADTARYLYENLAKWSQDSLDIHTALVCGGGQYKTSLGKVDLEHILTNFSPLSKKRDRQPELPQDQEIDLLDSAMENIKRTFARRATTSLLSGRDRLLPPASETPSSSDDMELVTWLVVMEPQS